MADPDGGDGRATGAGSTRRPADWSVFGDPLGRAVFLAALVVAGATWQVGFFITDTYAVANGLVNLADGHFTVDRVHYSLTLGAQPGLHVVDGRLYARNYGQAAAALPAYYALEALTAVARLELLLVGGWSLLVLAACRQVGVVVGRRRPFQLGGSVLAVAAFGASLPLARPIEAEMTGIVALQALSVLSVAVVALALYRLCTRVDGGSRRPGAVAGFGAVVATPLWFWAAVPKRHTLLAAVVATLLFWFAASRGSGPQVAVPFGRRVAGPVPAAVDRTLALRAMAYALAGLAAWVHAFEGGLLLATLAVADLATASTLSRRALVAVALGASAGLAPVLVTNVAVSGNPVEPPRLTDPFEPGGSVELGPGGTVQTDTGATDATGGGATEPGGGATEPEGGSVVGVLAERVRSSSAFGYARRIVTAVGDAPSKLYHTYVRSGRVDSITKYGVNAHETIDLTLAESFPLVGSVVGGLLGTVVARVRGGRVRDSGRTRADGGADGRVRRLLRRVRTADSGRQTGGFAALVVAGYATLYFPLLPLNTQLTVRYLLPTAPALVYLVARGRVVRRTVRTAGRPLAGAYAATAVLGLGVTVAVFPALGLAVGEAMQLHALVGLAACGVLVVVVALVRADFIDDTRISAAALGVAGGVTTVLVVRMQLVYFEYGTYAVPVVRRAAERLAA